MVTVRNPKVMEIQKSLKSAEIFVETELKKIEARHVYVGDIWIRPSASPTNFASDLRLDGEKIVDAKFDESEGSMAITLFLTGDRQWTCHRDEMIYIVRANISVTSGWKS